jgi:hypothetical protein
MSKEKKSPSSTVKIIRKLLLVRYSFIIWLCDTLLKKSYRPKKSKVIAPFTPEQIEDIDCSGAGQGY